jgi:hypothetical protein
MSNCRSRISSYPQDEAIATDSTCLSFQALLFFSALKIPFSFHGDRQNTSGCAIDHLVVHGLLVFFP